MLASLVARYAWLRNWSTQSTNRRIFSATVLVAALGMGGKLAGLVRDQAVAAGEGVGAQLDAYYAAIIVPMYAIGTLSMSLAPCLIPVYLRVRSSAGAAAAKRLAENCLFLGLALAGAVIAIILLTSQPILASMLSESEPDQRRLATYLLCELAAIVALSGASNVLSALLQAANRFAVPAITPCGIALASLASYALFGPGFGVHALALGVTFGYAAELAALALVAWRADLLVTPRWHGWSDDLRHIVRQYWPVVGGMALMGSNAMIDQAMAAPLGEGSISALNYGNKLTALATALGATSLGTTILPHLAQMVHAAEWSKLRHTLWTFVRWALLVTIPLSALGILGSTAIVRLLFERGQFTADHTLLVSAVQRWSLLQAPVYIVGVVGVRMLSALEQNHVLLKIGLMNVASNLLLDWLLRRWLGVAGIAAASAGVYLLSTIVVYALVIRKLREAQGGCSAPHSAA